MRKSDDPATGPAGDQVPRPGRRLQARAAGSAQSCRPVRAAEGGNRETDSGDAQRRTRDSPTEADAAADREAQSGRADRGKGGQLLAQKGGSIDRRVRAHLRDAVREGEKQCEAQQSEQGEASIPEDHCAVHGGEAEAGGLQVTAHEWQGESTTDEEVQVHPHSQLQAQLSTLSPLH